MININNPNEILKFIIDNVISLDRARQYISERKAIAYSHLTLASPEFLSGSGFDSVESLYYNGKRYYRNGGEFHTIDAIEFFDKYS